MSQGFLRTFARLVGVTALAGLALAGTALAQTFPNKPLKMIVGFAAGGPTMEICIVGDIPGLYYLLKHQADGEPDPVTGENTAISVTYYFETTPAFVVPGDTKRITQ